MIKRILTVFLSLILLAVFLLYSILSVAFNGPSPAVRDQLTLSLLETSAAKFVPGLFLSAGQVDEIVLNNSVVDSEIITDSSMVTTYKPQSASETDNGGSGNTGGSSAYEESDEWADYPDGIRMENVRGNTYRGYVILVRDPSRVYTATSSNFRSGLPGLRIYEVMEREGAVVAINGGGFPDVNGVGLGDVPSGLVFSKGEHLWGGENTVYSGVMGFDNNDILIVGNMSPKTAKEMGIRDAITFGPTLVVNGEPAEIRGAMGGLNPRSAIGQRADGTVIFLCVDGRMPSSMGASMADLIEIMLEYGAVNASNLDGGSSSHLYYNGEPVNISSSLYGPRRMPTFFMVKPLPEEN